MHALAVPVVNALRLARRLRRRHVLTWLDPTPDMHGWTREVQVRHLRDRVRRLPDRLELVPA